MRNVTRKFVLAAAGVMMTATVASAQDRLNITGSVDVSETGPGGVNILFDFLNPTTAVPTISGAFLPEISVGTTGNIFDFQVGPAGCVTCPVSPFLQIAGYTFQVTSTPLAPAGTFNYGPVQLISSGTGTIAAISVVGTVTGGDYGTMARNFSGTFTAQFEGETPLQVFTAIDAGGTRNVGYSAELLVQPTQVVPEPSTYMLLATGIGALGMVARRRRTNV